MRVSLQIKDCDLGEEFYMLVQESLDKLDRYPHIEMITAHIHIGRVKNRFKVDILLNCSHHGYKAASDHHLVQNAFDQAFARVARQVARQNAKFKKHNRDNSSDMQRSA